ncbi:borealin-2-like [Mantella aurantiaca]
MMSSKRTRKHGGHRAKGSGDSGVVMTDQRQEQKNEKIRLFMLDFIQQKKDRIEEVKKELEVLSVLPDQILEVELLKMPLSIRQMKVGDYYKLMGANKDEEAALVKVDGLDEELREVKIVRKNSKKGKGGITNPALQDPRCYGYMLISPPFTKKGKSPEPNASVHVSWSPSASPSVIKSKSFVGEIAKKPAIVRSVSATPLNKAPRKVLGSASSCRTDSQMSRNTRSSRNRAMTSLGDHQPLLEGFPLLHIPLMDGQTLSSAVDDLEAVDVELLRSDTVQHIHTLVGQLTNLCTKAYTQQQGTGQ